MLKELLLVGSGLSTSAVAWNVDVHNQIGFMAEQFLEPETSTLLAQLLEPKYEGSVGRAAGWADAYAHTAEGRFSYQWHWIDTHDQPPAFCHLDYEQDCAKGGCVVSAIANQTGILRECIQELRSSGVVSSRGSNLTCSYALKWVAHFFGDIHQPLHASGRAVGGNTYKVIFANQTTQLHAVWDHYIPYFAANVTKPFSNQSLDPFFGSLVSRIRSDDFLPPPALWLACSDPATPELCATAYAQESNRWDCDYVWANARNDTDLGTNGYALGGVPIVELQISKAGYRLGAWLNKLVQTAKPHVQQQVIMAL